MKPLTKLKGWQTIVVNRTILDLEKRGFDGSSDRTELKKAVDEHLDCQLKSCSRYRKTAIFRKGDMPVLRTEIVNFFAQKGDFR